MKKKVDVYKKKKKKGGQHRVLSTSTCGGRHWKAIRTIYVHCWSNLFALAEKSPFILFLFIMYQNRFLSDLLDNVLYINFITAIQNLIHTRKNLPSETSYSRLFSNVREYKFWRTKLNTLTQVISVFLCNGRDVNTIFIDTKVVNWICVYFLQTCCDI